MKKLGGGGRSVGGWPTGTKPKDLISVAASEEQAYEAEVNAYLQDLLADFNDRDIDAINKHLETIINAISKEFRIINLLYGGSVKKHTYIDGLSDVDVLAIVDRSELLDKSPSEVIDFFTARLRERLPMTEIEKGNLAVTVRFADKHEIQILPALKTKTGIRIASADGTNWSNVINPERFTKKLTSINQSNNNNVVPTIKLYKAINGQLSKNVQLSGYHIEAIAINAFENYDGQKTRKAMLNHLANFASTAILRPIKDITGQSLYVDDNLGAFMSIERQKISASIKRVFSRMKLADTEASVDRWKGLFGE